MKNQQTRDKSSFLSSNVMKVSSHFTVDICVFPLQTWGGGEEETHLPCSRLRKDIQENISAPGSRPIAHRRAAVCLQLGFLREAFHAQRRVAAARSDAHRWPRTFVWTWLLRNHSTLTFVSSHVTGDKRFECSQCQKRFMRSDHLTKHYKTHINTKNL